MIVKFTTRQPICHSLSWTSLSKSAPAWLPSWNTCIDAKWASLHITPSPAHELLFHLLASQGSRCDSIGIWNLDDTYMWSHLCKCVCVSVWRQNYKEHLLIASLFSLLPPTSQPLICLLAGGTHSISLLPPWCSSPCLPGREFLPCPSYWRLWTAEISGLKLLSYMSRNSLHFLWTHNFQPGSQRHPEEYNQVRILTPADLD